MRGTDAASGALFSYVDLEERIPSGHPLRKIRQIVNDALASLDAEFDALYTKEGRPSIAPERLIRASLLQMLFSIRSERQLMEQMDYNLLFRWFVGLGIDDPVWVPTPEFDSSELKPLILLGQESQKCHNVLPQAGLLTFSASKRSSCSGVVFDRPVKARSPIVALWA